MRLIDADALFPYGTVIIDASDGFATANKLLEIIKNAPTTDPASLRPKGEWIEHDCYCCNSNGDPIVKTGTVFVCSECGREERHREPFCHCGADMRAGRVSRPYEEE